ncbi:MAG: site-specific integrase [Thermoplasmata archaeon]|nr:site-specific integrase [Thermoplasmata archaeon]
MDSPNETFSRRMGGPIWSGIMNKMVWKVDMSQVNEYTDFLLSRSRKQVTVDGVRMVIHRMLAKLQENGRPTRAEDISVEDILFLYSTRTNKENVCKQDLRILSRFCCHYTGRDIEKQAGLLWNRAEYDRTWITPEDFRILYKAADPTDRMVLVLGAFMGLRRTEICSIRESDIKDGKITIHGKGHTEQGFVVRMEMLPQVAQELESYRKWKETKECRDDYLLQVEDHHMNVYNKMAPMTLNCHMRNLSIKTGVKVTAHSLRRLFATILWHELDTDLVTVKTMMRHASAATTLQCYIDAYSDKEDVARQKFTNFMTEILA